MLAVVLSTVAHRCSDMGRYRLGIRYSILLESIVCARRSSAIDYSFTEIFPDKILLFRSLSHYAGWYGDDLRSGGGGELRPLLQVPTLV